MAAQHAGGLPPGDPRPRVDLMMATIDGVKFRASFQSGLAGAKEQGSLVEGLMAILAQPAKGK